MSIWDELAEDIETEETPEPAAPFFDVRRVQPMNITDTFSILSAYAIRPEIDRFGLIDDIGNIDPERATLIRENPRPEIMQLLSPETRERVINAQAVSTVMGIPFKDVYDFYYMERKKEPSLAGTVGKQIAATFGGTLPKAVGNLFKVGGTIYQEWDDTVGKALDYTGLPVEYRGIIAESLGRTIGRAGDQIYKFGTGVEEYWQPQVTGAKKYVAQAIDTLTTMLIGASTGYTLPFLAGVAGLEKAAEALREGYPTGRAVSAGVSSGLIEAGTEYLPLKILGKPGQSFVKRLSEGMIADIPGELAATFGDMKLIDEQMLGKSYTIGEYAQAMLDTLIVSSLVTGIGTTVTHPFVEDVSRKKEKAKTKLDNELDRIQKEEMQARVATEEGAIPTEGDIEGIAKRLTPEEALEAELPEVLTEKDIEEYIDRLARGEESIEEGRDRIKAEIQESMPDLTDEEIETTLALTIDAPARALGMTSDEFVNSQALRIQGEIAAGELLFQGGVVPPSGPELTEWIYSKSKKELVTFISDNELPISIGKLNHDQLALKLESFIKNVRGYRTLAGGKTDPYLFQAARGDVLFQEKETPEQKLERKLAIEKPIVEAIMTDVKQGRAGSRMPIKDAAGVIVGYEGIASTFPDYFRDKGYTKKETLNIINKYLAGKKLTDKQSAILEDLIKGKRGEMDAMTGEMMAEAGVEISPRGAIQFATGKTIISLLKGADKTTFAHEMFHSYVNIMATTPELSGALEVLENWIGKPYIEWTVPDKEKAARSGELYLWEGNAPTQELATVFETFKQWLREIYRSAMELNVELSPEVRALWDEWFGKVDDLVSFDFSDEGLAAPDVVTPTQTQPVTPTQGKTLPSPKIIKPAKKPTKTLIREVTGQVKPATLVKEHEALEAAFKKAAAAARKAYSEGKKTGVEEQKVQLRNILNRAKKIRAVRDMFGLTDADMKKISRSNPLLMSQYGFKLYIDDVRQKAFELQENKAAKLAVYDLIRTKSLGKHENLIGALELPAIADMTTEQANKFFDLLNKYQEGDEFMPQRILETVDKTDLEGIRTWREAKERVVKDAQKYGYDVKDISEVSDLKVGQWDMYKYDSVLMNKDPLFRIVVTEVTRVIASAELRAHEIEQKALKLAKAAEKSRSLAIKQKITNALIPQDKDIVQYMEAPEDKKSEFAAILTKEQLDYAHFIEQYWRDALNRLIEIGALEQGRENYFVHIKQDVLENIKEKGFLHAIKNIFKDYEQQLEVFTIIDDTGKYLPYEKFFPFALPRTEQIDPTYNVTRAFMTYVRLFEKKVALDSIVPKLAIYAQAVTPQKLTPRGLEMDKTVKEFIYKYINNKKGRHIEQLVGRQGGIVDTAMRALKTVISLLDLGFSLPVSVGAFVGEQALTFAQYGLDIMYLGSRRMVEKQGRMLAKKYAGNLGKTTFEIVTSPEQNLGGKFKSLAFALLHESSRLANLQGFLGSLTQEEYESGNISDQRVAEILLDMGRMRVIPGSKSLFGSTSVGSLVMQYKTWAAGPAITLIKDIDKLSKDIFAAARGEKPLEATLNSAHARELYRIVGMSVAIIAVGSMVYGDEDDEDETMRKKVLRRVYTESLTIMQAIDPSVWGTVRAARFLGDLSSNLSKIVKLEQYEDESGFKGFEGLRKQFTPRTIKQIFPEE